MKKRLFAFTAIILCLGFILTGCGNNEPSYTPHSKKDQTPTQAGNNPAGNETNPSPTEAGAPSKGERSPLVSAVYKDKSGNLLREDFEFYENVEYFTRDDLEWTLDLRGNTVIVDSVITVSNKLTITNGALLPLLSDWYSITEKGSVLFGKTDLGSLTVYAENGCTGFTDAENLSLSDVTVIVDGGTGIHCRKKQIAFSGELNIQVVSGTGIINDEGVLFKYLSPTSTITVNEKGTGIENHGEFQLQTGMTVSGGTGVRNYPSGNLENGYRFVVESGLGIYNEGSLNIREYAFSVKSGQALYNTGTVERAVFFTVPGEVYTGTLCYNDETGKIGKTELYIFTAKNAIGVDNFGQVTDRITLNAGLPSYSVTHIQNSYISPFFETMNPENTLENSTLFKNEPSGSVVSENEDHVFIEITINANEEEDYTYNESVTGFVNHSSSDLNANVTVYMIGKGGYGFANGFGSTFESSYIKLFSKSNETIGNNTVFFSNEGTLRFKTLSAEAVGTGNICIMNSGTIEYSDGSRMILNVPEGSGNTCIVNDGAIECKPEIELKGENNTGVINNNSFTVSSRFSLKVSGNNTTGITNSGLVKINDLYTIGGTDQSLGCKNNVAIRNNNVFEVETASVQACSESGGIGIYNGESGNFRAKSLTLAAGHSGKSDDCINTGMHNEGVVNIETLKPYVYNSKCILLINEGDFVTNGFNCTMEKKVVGGTFMDNTGNIQINGNLHLTYHEGSKDTWKLGNGAIAVLGETKVWHKLDDVNDSFELSNVY